MSSSDTWTTTYYEQDGSLNYKTYCDYKKEYENDYSAYYQIYPVSNSTVPIKEGDLVGINDSGELFSLPFYDPTSPYGEVVSYPFPAEEKKELPIKKKKLGTPISRFKFMELDFDEN